MRKKYFFMNMGILLLVSMIAYPIFAEDTTMQEATDPLITEQNTEKKEEILESEINESNDTKTNALNSNTRANIGTQFTANIINDGLENLLCHFEVITPATDEQYGTVKIQNSVYDSTSQSYDYKVCIDIDTEGMIAFPEKISDGYSYYTIVGIGRQAFKGCSKITSTGLDGNGSITFIEYSAFSNCSKLVRTGLENNNAVQNLDSQVFANCTSLISTGLESNTKITSLNYGIFDGCIGLTSTGLERNRTIERLGGVFNGCIGLASTGLENNNTVKELESTFNNCTNLKSTGLENNDTVTSIKSAFYGCSELTGTGLENNDTVTLIESAFERCSGLTSTGLEKNTTITKVDKSAFYGCSRLTSTGLEKNTTITMVDSNAFRNCTGLISTGLSKNTTVTTIGVSAFNDCKNLTDTGLERNTTITSIGTMAFSSCDQLGELIFEITTLPKMDPQCFWATVDIYYLPETTNPEVLNNSGATSINKMAITNIGVNSRPTKTTYIEEQNFDPTGLVLDVTYDKIGTKQRSYTDSNFASCFGFDKTEVVLGDKSIEITYGGKSTTQVITVKEKSVIDIKVKTEPIKVKYIERENFEADGLVLTVYYDNGKNEDVTYDDSTKGNFSFDKTEVKLGNKSIAITYGGKSTTQAITVIEKSVTNIKVKIKPTKVNYIEGQAWNPKGLVITVHYDNGKSEDITYNDSTKNSFSFDKKEVALGDSSVTISYGGKTTTQNITVVKKVLTGIKVKTAPKKTNYIEEEMFDPTGLVITTIYNDEIEETVDYNDSTKGNFGFDKTEVVLGDKSIEITYGGKSTTQAITVKEKSVIDIKVKTEPTKVKYIEREDFEADGLVLTVNYDNGKNEDITYSDSTKDDFSFDITIVNYRDTEIVITYKGKTVSQAIEVEAKPIKEIEVKAKPNKVEYIEGTVFDPTGMNITVNYEDGDSAIIPYNEKTKIDFSFQIVSKDRILVNEELPLLELGNTNMEVRYRNEVSATLAIEVIEKQIDKLTVVTHPTKLEYQEGEVFSLEGLVLEVIYNNGSKEEVVYNESTRDMFTYYQNKLTSKDTKIIVDYQGKKVEIEIKVNGIPDTDKESLQMIDTKDSASIEGYIMLVGITLASIGIIKYRSKES